MEVCPHGKDIPMEGIFLVGRSRRWSRRCRSGRCRFGLVLLICLLCGFALALFRFGFLLFFVLFLDPIDIGLRNGIFRGSGRINGSCEARVGQL